MSISAILSSSSAALLSTQAGMGVVNTNVTNASNDDYARRTYSTSALTSTNAALSGEVARAGDAYLQRSLGQTSSNAAYADKIDAYLKLYEASLGGVDEQSDLSSLLDAFASALASASDSTAATDTGASAVSAASDLADQLNELSQDIQALRTRASRDLSADVASANSLLQDLDALNDRIVRANAAGADLSDLEDERDTALRQLSQLLDVRTYTQSDNRLIILTASGETLLGATASALAYTSAGALSSETTYPGAIAALTLNGQDITKSVTGGSMGAAIALRDDILVEEQAALDDFATAFIQAVNEAANASSAWPGSNTLTSASTLNGGEALSGQGLATLLVLDGSGVVSARQTLDLASFATIDDLIASINAGGVASAALLEGRLVLSVASPEASLAISADGTSLGDAQKGFSAYFGFQDVFAGESAADIKVRPALKDGDISLASAGVLDANPGESAIKTGEGAARLAQALQNNRADGQASLEDWAHTIVSAAASLIADAASQASRAASQLSYIESRLGEVRGVNIDEETAALTLLQTQYEANAQMITAAQEMFDTLLNMVS